MQSKISVIIPCYNAEMYIAETIQSVTNQILRDTEIEIIIINDGSTDGSRSVLTQFDSISNLTVYHQENAGVSRARNKGIELAKGDFIQFLDSDDLLSPKKLQIQVDALIGTGYDVAYGDWQKLEEKPSGEFVDAQSVVRKMTCEPEIALFTDFWCPPAAILYSRKIVDRIGGFRETLPIIQDARYFLDAALQGGRFVYTAGVMAKYRVHRHNSLSKSQPLKFVTDCFTNAMEVKEIWSQKGGLTVERKEALLKVLFSCCRFFYQNDRELFNSCYNQIRIIDPRAYPKRPFKISLFSRFIGYENTEYLSAIFRKLKGHFS